MQSITRAAAPRWLTGSEPAPLSRGVSAAMMHRLDIVAETARYVLGQQAHTMGFHLRSIALFYPDSVHGEQDYAGFMVCFISHNLGKPCIHCYGISEAVCWNGHDTKEADTIRQAMGLRRYSLFTRVGYDWQFNHAGQLPVWSKKEELD